MKIESITGASSIAFEDKTSLAQKSEGISHAEGKKQESMAPVVTSSDKYSRQSDDKKENSSREASERQIKNAVSQANRKMQKLENTSLEFAYHEPTKRVSIKVIDKDTKEVVREIPPEKSLDMLQKMWELAGILVDEKR
ncbi:MAG: flagellar protein FlaG [Clostridiales bacterium]|nr:flagellar protein FlaG [Clostridiales bacterium]